MKIISTFKKPSSFFGSSSKKKPQTRSVTRTETLSFGSGSNTTTSSSEDSAFQSHTTPNSVLPPKITRRELEMVLRRLGPDPPTEEEVVAMLAEADREGNGSISLEEIVALGSDPVVSELEETFRVFDADGDGKISAEELMGLFVTVGDEGCTLEDCRRMIRVVDSDGDGFVCFADFVRMMDLQR